VNDVNSYARNLLRTRGRRCVATILSYLEDNAWEHVPKEKQRHIRSHILSTVGEFQDLATDMVVADTGTINDFWVEELRKIHDEIRGLSDVHAQN
jgi:hypothetical protein